MPRHRLFLVFFFVAAVAFPLDDRTLRADVEQYLASLNAAWKSGDRQKVLGHFQHGDLMPPTETEYAMLGRLRFWDKRSRASSRKMV